MQIIFQINVYILFIEFIPNGKSHSGNLLSNIRKDQSAPAITKLGSKGTHFLN